MPLPRPRTTGCGTWPFGKHNLPWQETQREKFIQMEQKGRRARPEGRLPAEGRQTPPPLAATHALTSQGEGKPWSCDALGVSTPEVLKAPHRTFFETDRGRVSLPIPLCCFLSTTMLRCKNSSHAQWGFFFLFFNFNKVISALRKQKIMHQSQGRPGNPRPHHPPGR